MRAFHFLKLFRTRLLLLMLLLAIPALGLVLYGNFEERRIETTLVGEDAVHVCQLAAAKQENFVQNTRQLLTTVSQLSFLVFATNPTVCEVHFSNLRKLLPDYLNFGLIETNGRLFCTAEPADRAIDLSDRSYFQRVKETRKFATGDFLVGRVTGDPSLVFGYPVFDDRGKLARVLYAALRLSRLSDAIAQVPLPVEAAITLLDSHGNVLARQPSPETWVGKNLTNAPVIRRILRGHDRIFEMAGVDGVPRLHAVSRIGDGGATGLVVVVDIPLEVSFARANADLVRNLMIFTIVAFLAWSAVRIYSQRFFLRPVSSLAAAARQLAEGNLNSRVGDIQGSAELAQLGAAFDEMAGRLQQRRAELEQAHEQIRRLNEDLERRVEERTSDLEAANQELEAFSYSVSHDLRAPLRAIDGFSQALLEESSKVLSAENQDYLTRIRESAGRMSHLIDALLSLSRVTGSDMRRTKVDLSRMAENILHELRKADKPRQVEAKIPPGLTVSADANLLQIAMENLLGNAWKFTRRTPNATIEVGEFRHDGIAEFFVRDNGAGFDMAYAGKLFGPFQRLHRITEFEGTGIGLATVHRVIRRHGGRVRAEAALGKGAAFFFTLS